MKIEEYCKRNNISIEKNIVIDKYTIDYKLDNYLFKIYEDSEELLNFCKNNHIILLADKNYCFGKPNTPEHNGFKYAEYPLLGVDINLFDNPEFPYRKDRPKCFYDVRVMNQKSALEAFNDETIRWKMIKNRLEYSGGFIDSNQILNALNITRTCKQPSWFSKEFAKKILKKYATTTTIVDPFAGWGARYDACKDLKLNYIGCDLNKDLVDWHHSLGRDIKYDDANNFKYDGICTVFICPPYQNVEKYFDSQDSDTTQCGWLKKVMENVPNAKEYIMVCKIVDKGWEQFVIDEKINKSHFGKNTEHIIVVKDKSAIF